MPPINFTGIAYNQDFNSLANSGTTNTSLPEGWEITETGGGARDNEQYAADTGASNTGDTYSYGSAFNAERALGGLRSGTLIPTIGVSFTNNTGSAITSLNISYRGEQWRLGASGRTDRLDFQYSLDATSLTTGTWTDVNTLDFISPNPTATAGALDGNAAGNNTTVTGVISGLNIANGATFYLRWQDFDATGADDGLAIDDFSLSVSSPLPTVSIAAQDANAAEAGQDPGTFRITRTGDTTNSLTVNYTVSGTSTNGTDYTPTLTGAATIAAGQSFVDITITPVDDALIEGNETLSLTLSPSANYTVGTPSDTVTIVDNDAPATPTVNLSVSANASTEAGTTVITVTAATTSGAVSGNQTVSLGVSGTGITTSDYYLSNTTITIPNGQTSGSVSFIVADDAIPEGTETAILTISNPSAGISLGATTSQNITITNNNNSFLTKVGGITSANGAEIPAFDPGSDRLFVVAGSTVDIYTVSNTGSLNAAGSLAAGITAPSGTELLPNSVAVKNGIVAVAYAIRETATGVQQIGRVGFFNAATGAFLNSVAVGALPDMLTFTPDGTKVLVANEGEPNSYNQAGSVDPEGSVSIIDIAGGVANATVQNVSFTSFNSQLTALRNAGVRITGPNATVAQDLEPEYIAVSPDGATARITLQENNAVAILDIASATITSILPLGAKNHNLPGNGIDASDRDVDGTSAGGGRTNIQNWPVFGLYQPDAIASFTVNGQTYYITANEGDARDYTGFTEELRVGAAGYVLDPSAFPDGTTLKQNANLGRLTVTTATGDIEGDGDFDRIEAFGARSFSIWDANGNQVFDSGDQLEQITAAKTPTLFNSDGTAASFDTRSDNKGPEPEGVTVGVINGRTYAFIGLERTGDVIVYDVSNPSQPAFVQYINTPEDVAPEGLTFISAADSPTGKSLLVTANEVSKTVTVFEVNLPTLISTVQGNGGTSPLLDKTVTIEGVVIADFQLNNQLRGFFIQEEDTDRDGDSATSEAIFVFTGSNPPLDVQEGQIVRVTGSVSEFFNMTQITATTAGSITLVNGGNNLSLVTPTIIDLPATGDINSFYEQSEGMLVRFADKMYVSEYLEVARYGQIVLTADGRPFQYSHTDNTPTAAEYTAFLDDLNRKRIILDDDDNIQNAPLNDGVGKFFYPQPGGFGTGTQGTNYFRGGDTISNLTGVLHWSFAGQTGTDAWRIRPTQANPATFTVENPRSATPPNVGGNIKVASFNVLNYFITIDNGSNGGRGADSVDEFNRQNEKLISALIGLNADVVGLMEIENNGSAGTPAVKELVDRLNAQLGGNVYDYINTGNVGTDQITVAFIYKRSVVEARGAAAILTNPAFTDPNNTGQQRSRPAIAQTFRVIDSNNVDFGESFNVVVNHLKSKGGNDATGADIDQNDGQGQFNDTRTKAANYLVNTWIPSDPTGQGDPDFLIIGDLNAYKGETPITAIKNAGYTDLVEAYGGNNAYGYVFNGQLGYLDHALANTSLASQVTGVAEWRINADEVPVFDYNNSVDDGAGEASFEAKPTGNNLYEPNPFRTSDHDPVIIGLNLGSTPPGVTITESGNSTNVAEGGATDSYTVKLNSLPTGVVTININPGNQLTTNTTTLTFTPNNWNQEQTVTVTAVDDAAVEGNHTGTITHTVVNSGTNYDNVSIAPISVNITDNDSVNNPPTGLTLSANNVNENVPANTVIGTFTTTDPNQGNTFTYSFVEGGVDNSFFTINGNSLIINQSPDFETKSSYNIRVRTTDQDGSFLDTFLVIGVNDLPDTQPNPQTQLLNPKDDVFNISGVSAKVRLKVQFSGRNSNLVNELGVYTVDDQNGTVNGIAPGAAGYPQAVLERSKVIFSVLANNPNGFNPNNLSRLLEFDSNQNLRFYLIKNSTFDTVKQNSTTSDILFSSTTIQKITSLTTGGFALGWKDGSNTTATEFNDLVVNLTATEESTVLGTSLQGAEQAELIDLRSISGSVSAKFTVNREAAFDNFVGFYRVTGANGGVDINNDGVADLLPGQAGYVQAAINQRVAGINLTVNNQATATYTGTLAGGAIFAPFIIANGRPEALLDSNTNNDPAVYFPYLGANSDRTDHIRLLGDNVFGFEDLPNGGDRDYNDVLVKVDLSIA
jgi:predicted extracellular nuclease